MINLTIDPISLALVSIILSLLLRIQKNLGEFETKIKDTVKEIERIEKDMNNINIKLENHEIRILKLESTEKRNN
jgi:septal ring factor EnvC (AmiA/AmiB activator)